MDLSKKFKLSIVLCGIIVFIIAMIDMAIPKDKCEVKAVITEEIEWYPWKLTESWDSQEIPELTGSTSHEKFKELAYKYWLNPSAIWEVENKYNIREGVILAIIIAETSWGKFGYGIEGCWNYWNVWNNDRWDRVGYSTPYAGARVIPLTLNNQHLWNYHTINQLSRYGNSDWKIYASSPINWQTNVMKCLSKIKWYTVPEDFPFRVWPNPNL